MPHYDEGRLARLLRLLRAAPQEWIRTAQRIPFRTMTLTDRDLEELGRKLERDPSFRKRFDADPAAAAEAAGMQERGRLRRAPNRCAPSLEDRSLRLLRLLRHLFHVVRCDKTWVLRF